jgi:hypothetical protein
MSCVWRRFSSLFGIGTAPAWDLAAVPALTLVFSALLGVGLLICSILQKQSRKGAEDQEMEIL